MGMVAMVVCLHKSGQQQRQSAATVGPTCMAYCQQGNHDPTKGNRRTLPRGGVCSIEDYAAFTGAYATS
ncbi:hypothetical protein D3C71_1987810 [compost metagenome]